MEWADLAKKYNNHEKKVVVVDLLLHVVCVCVVEFLRCARDFQSKEPLALGSMNSTIDPTSGETLSTIEPSIGYVCSRARSQNVLRCDVVANL